MKLEPVKRVLLFFLLGLLLGGLFGTFLVSAPPIAAFHRSSAAGGRLRGAVNCADGSRSTYLAVEEQRPLAPDA